MPKRPAHPPPVTDSDSTVELLSRLRAGDPSAADEIVRRNLRPLQRWAHGRLPRHARGGADTEDLVQETLVRALGRLASFDPSHPGALQAYLRSAVRNRVVDEVRRAKRRPAEALEDEVRDPRATPLDAAMAAETDALYRTALDSLRPADQAILRARIDRAWDYEKIARAFEKPSAAAARMAVNRAVQRLCAALQAGTTPRR